MTASILATLKQPFEKELGKIVALHKEGAQGTRTALLLTVRLDGLIREIFKRLDHPQKNLVAVVALGGYGRKELCFASDTDIMVLVANESTRSAATGVMQEFLHALLDVGLDIGHSFRTVDECLDFARGDLEPWISLLETRYICGNLSASKKLTTRLQKHLSKSDHRDFVRRLTELIALRHEKYGNSTKLLEPNIKNSAGGLRDAHAVLWMLRGTGSTKFPATDSTPREPLLVSLFEVPAIHKLFSRDTLRQARRAIDFLLRTRDEMHLQAGSIHDTLEFTFQRRVAEGLGYRGTKERTSVERFMQEYYSSARIIAQIADRVLAGANDKWVRKQSAVRTRRLSSQFVLRSNAIEQTRPSSRLDNEDILTAVLYTEQHGAGLSHDLEDRVLRSLPKLKPLKTSREGSLFRTILNQPSGVGETFRRMNGLGLLARWIPEWKPMVAFFQHNQYHYYTADEHTLTVIANAESLAQSPSSFGEVFRLLERRDTLYLASFLHDIAKPIRIGTHEVAGVGIAKTILTRLQYEDVLDDVLFLVRNHLVMEQVAFRRNLNDPLTIADFAARVKSRSRLDLLYVLTYSDLSAVNKHVWTEWKEMLLFDLYKKTRAALDSRMTSEEIQQWSTEQSSAAAAGVSKKLSKSFSREEIQRHLNLIENPSYLAAFTVDEIGEQLQALKQDRKVSLLFNHWSDFTEITVIAGDAPFALSKFCGVLSANDANIFDASIFTRNDGLIIDKFRVVDFFSKSVLTEAQCRKIRTEMADVLEGKTDIVNLLQRHRMKWKRRSAGVNPNIRIDVEFENHPKFTIIDVFATDTLGFLHKVTETISKLGLNISFAKIATRVDGIVDTFYVLDMQGKTIEDPDRREAVRSGILATVRDLAESELATTT
ncbi:MAG: [protein-PII] uridylyltransferase [Bacteroidota bacterium]